MLCLIVVLPVYFSCMTRQTVEDPLPDDPAEMETTVPETTIEPPVDVEQPEQEFIVTEEIYDKTYSEVEELVMELNIIIRNMDFETWKTFLSDAYIARNSDNAYLQELQERPILKRENIVLRNLKDYFVYVVVPSRSNATVSQIDFIDEHHVKAISLTRQGPAVLYFLVRSGESWKITVLDDGE